MNKKEQEYIQGKINKIRNSEDKQSRIAWQAINEVSRMKSIPRAKLKVFSQEERIQTWEEHFQNLLGNSPKVSYKPITVLINSHHTHTQSRYKVEVFKIL